MARITNRQRELLLERLAEKRNKKLSALDEVAWKRASRVEKSTRYKALVRKCSEAEVAVDAFLSDNGLKFRHRSGSPRPADLVPEHTHVNYHKHCAECKPIWDKAHALAMEIEFLGSPAEMRDFLEKIESTEF